MRAYVKLTDNGCFPRGWSFVLGASFNFFEPYILSCFLLTGLAHLARVLYLFTEQNRYGFAGETQGSMKRRFPAWHFKQASKHLSRQLQVVIKTRAIGGCPQLVFMTFLLISTSIIKIIKWIIVVFRSLICRSAWITWNILIWDSSNKKQVKTTYNQRYYLQRQNCFHEACLF